MKRTKGKQKTRDISSKNVLDNPVLCAQFLRDNVKVPLFKDVRPEDIEDVSERYRPFLGTEFESDTVKRIWLHDENENRNEPLFLISLTEHKSVVDYDVAMQLLKYMLCIWLEYGKEMEQKNDGITSRKNFCYPAIIPVVYYEGKKAWTADRHFCGRIAKGNLFQNWIPDFTYEVVRIHDYSNEELLERGNEMSLIMLFNKIQNAMDLSEFLKLPQDKLNRMVKDTPETVLEVIVSVMESLCMKVGASEEETEECVQKVKERKMGYMFEHMEKMNIQEERQKTARAEKWAEEAERKAKEAEQKAEEAEQKAEEAEQKAEKAERKAEEAEKKAKESEHIIVKSIVSICQKHGVSKEQAIIGVMENCKIDRETAEEKVNQQW
ncbi:MAG: Rpn family recombination-promoting nuclease/putative transposase [Suilimivivens sp.]